MRARRIPFGLGLAFNRTRFDVDVDSRGDVSIDYVLEDPSVFITFLVPGLK